jgi:hypothetical protein
MIRDDKDGDIDNGCGPPPTDGVEPEERKERVLHTRVPESLDRQLRRRARSLGMSVSTVVRHVLLNTFGLVEDIVTDSANIALAVSGQEAIASPERRRAPMGAAAATEVLAWQEAVLNVNAVCGECNAMLPRGTRAAIGVRAQPGPCAVICRGCLDKIEGRRGARRRR